MHASGVVTASEMPEDGAAKWLQCQPAGTSSIINKLPMWLTRQPSSSNADISPEENAEEPTTPTRTSSASGVYSVGLNTQYSSDDDLEEAAVAVHPQRFAVGSLKQHHPQQWRASTQAVAVVVACFSWILVSSATILINKRIMVDLSFHFPAAVAALGMMGTTVASFVVCAVLRVVPCKATVTPYFYFTRIMTTGFFMALSFQAGNTAYLYLSVAFVQMLKAFTPVSTMLCGFAFRLEKASLRLMAAVGCICCGVLVSSYGELNFSLFGMLAMLTSIAAEGLRTVMMQHLLAAKQFHPLEAWMYLGPACTTWLLLLIGVCEGQQILDQHALGIVVSHSWYFGFAALAGFAVNALAMLVIKLASALTLKVLGICKDIGLVAFGVLLLGEHVATLQVFGYSVSLMGFGYYNYVKCMSSTVPEPMQPQHGSKRSKAGLSWSTDSSGDHDSSSSIGQGMGLIGAVQSPTSLSEPLLHRGFTGRETA